MEDKALWKQVNKIMTKSAYEAGIALQWRKNFDEKIDKVVKFTERTPCAKHTERMKWLTRSIAGVWAIVLIIIAFLVAGCAIHSKVYLPDDSGNINMTHPIAEVVQDTQGALTFNGSDVIIEVDTRKPTAWERFISPVLSSTAQAAKNNVK